MQFKAGHFQLKIHPTFILYLILIASLSSAVRGICVLLALLVHEAGHLIAMRIVGEPFGLLEFTPFGGVITPPSGKSGTKGIRGFFIALAGPLANYLVIQIIALPQLICLIPADWAAALFASNLTMLALNVLPAFPLDGGQMVLAIGYYFFPLSNVLFVLAGAGCLLSVGLVCFALYGFVIYGTLNCSLLILGIFIFVYARKSRYIHLAENIYVLLEDRENRRRSTCEIRLMKVTKGTRLLTLLRFADGPKETIFLSQQMTDLRTGINIDRIGRLLLKFGNITIDQAEELINTGDFTE